MDKTQLALEHSELKAAEDDLRKLISDSNFDMETVGEKITVKNWNKERIKSLISLLDREKPKLLYASLNHHISGYGETITQSDWLLKLILGTSELSTIQYPLLQLILSTVDSNGVQTKKLYELSKDMLLKTIESLEIISEAS